LSSALKLYMHPLASFCWKTLIALYENQTPFVPIVVDLGNETSRAAFLKVWPLGKFPVLSDETRGVTVPESSIIIEYLTQYHPGAVKLIPEDPDLAREARAQDRFFDLYVHEPMQKLVTDKLRPEGKNDPYGVEQARKLLDTSYAVLDRELTTKTFAAGEHFTLADCAAAPALYYANLVRPFEDSHEHLLAYARRIHARPSFVRVLKEAEPYFAMFPK
jgi:glutathione S-transferase